MSSTAPYSAAGGRGRLKVLPQAYIERRSLVVGARLAACCKHNHRHATRREPDEVDTTIISGDRLISRSSATSSSPMNADITMPTVLAAQPAMPTPAARPRNRGNCRPATFSAPWPSTFRLYMAYQNAEAARPRPEQSAYVAVAHRLQQSS